MNTALKSRYFLNNDQHERFKTLVLERTGILFGPKRRSALGRGITLLCKEAAENDLDRYFQMLQVAETNSPLWDALVKELTVGETYFFRDEKQIEALRQYVLPRIIAEHQHDRRIRIWSAACATGEEAYTLSMLLAELLLDIHLWNITILATDINKTVLKKGRAAHYRPWSFRQTDPSFQSRYFRQKGEAYEVIPRIRENVHFAYLNLNEPVYPSLFTNTNAMDLILCRNVAIYYSEAVIRQVAERFHRCLIWGGWLMMGAAETGIPVFDAYAARIFSGGTVFQKLRKPFTKPFRFHGKSANESICRTPVPITPVKPTVFEETAKEDSQLTENGFIQKTTNPVFSGETAPALDFFQKGIHLVRQKRYEEAMDAFLTCIAQNPKDAESLYQMGLAHANLGRMESAKLFCEQAIEINPLISDAYYTLALIHQESGNMKDALDKLKRALFLKPDFALAHFSMAVLFRRLDKNDQSDRHRDQAVKLLSRMAPETPLSDAEALTAGTLLTMAKTLK